MRILFVGDVFGSAGRGAVERLLPGIVAARGVDYVVANVENAAGGLGVTPDLAEAFLAAGVDVMTSGNHIWDRREIEPFLASRPELLRPHNYPDAPGSGVHVRTSGFGVPVAVVNLQGRIFLPPIDCPFRTADRVLEEIRGKARVIVVDVHAEATSEKIALARHLDGRVTAVIGTHTHVQTADERVLPGGTAYLTDVGMTGPWDSVIGMEAEGALRRFRTQRPIRLRPAEGDVRLSAALLDADEETGRARSIERLVVPVEEGGR